MLIKANFICGDKSLYNKFSDYLSHFIYPASFSVSPLEQIKELKYTIEKKLKDEENIKLTSGGIRNIEFSVQALQLLNGGRFPEIRTPNTLEAISKLKGKKLITEKESIVFTEAYTFYRKIEHYLQLMNDTQTHTIPQEGNILNNLSSFLGFNSTDAFKRKVAVYRTEVLNIYNSIIGGQGKKDEKRDETRLVFQNKIKAEKNLGYLKAGRGILDQKQFDKKSTLAFLAIEEHLFDYLAKSKSPDIILENFTRVMRDNPFPSIWYNEFQDKKFFEAFLTICEYSQKSVDLFAEDEDLREYFISKKFLGRLNKEKLKNLNTKTFLFHLLCLFTLKIIQPKRVSSILKSFFVEKIKYLSDASLNIESENYFIAALGSFGSGEMSFASDIDLIFVVEKTDKSNKLEKEFQSFLLKLKKEFSPFDVDCRLRPEGKSSQLVWEFAPYKEYLSKRARIWEFQAFCKLNIVSGNRVLFNKFTKAITGEIARLNKKELKKNILEMRRKLYPADLSGLTELFNIKKSRGGITDIEFVLQYLILSNPKYFSSLKGKRNEQIIEKLSINKSIRTRKENLIEGYYFLKKLELANQNIFNVSNSQIILESDKLNMVLTFMELNSLAALKNQLSRITKLNYTLFGIFFKQ